MLWLPTHRCSATGHSVAVTCLPWPKQGVFQQTQINKQTTPPPQTQTKPKKLPPTPPPLLLPGMEYMEEHISLGTGAFVTGLFFVFFFNLAKGPAMFNFETRSSFMCTPGIFSSEGPSLSLARRGSAPAAGESRLYFPVGSAWGTPSSPDVYTAAQTLPAQRGERLARAHSTARGMDLDVLHGRVLVNLLET